VIGGLVAWFAASPWVRAALRYGAVALAILLFLLALRRSGQRAGRLVEQLETTEKANDVNAGCWKRQLAVLVIATSLLSGCATVGSDLGGLGACPPVVEYSREFQAQAAEQLALLPERSAVEEMLSDYAVMREQARLCSRP
jgi:heme A synthase